MATVKMYSTQWCGYCAAARDLLRTKGVEFEDIDIQTDPTLRAEMIEKSGGTTVPQIFIDDQPVGGYTDIAQLEQDGKLDTLLAGN